MLFFLKMLNHLQVSARNLGSRTGSDTHTIEASLSIDVKVCAYED